MNRAHALCVLWACLLCGCAGTPDEPAVPDRKQPSVVRPEDEQWRTTLRRDPQVRAEVEALLAELAAHRYSEVEMWWTLSAVYPPGTRTFNYAREVWDYWDDWMVPTFPQAYTKIVQLGAQAVPVLCEYLVDERLTSMRWDQPDVMGGTWFAHEYDWNDGWQDSPGDEFHYFGSPSVEGKLPHTFTIGDICYSLIGAIVNRNFNALRSQPTMCWVINSPIVAPELARLVRGDWSDLTPERLRQSLIRDFETPDLAGNERNDRRAGAYHRLATYFPDDAIRLTRAMLRKPMVNQFEVWDRWEILKRTDPSNLATQWDSMRSGMSAAQVEVLIGVLRSVAHSVLSFRGDPNALRVLNTLFPGEDPAREREYWATTNVDVGDFLFAGIVLDDDEEIDRLVAGFLANVESLFPGDTNCQQRLASACIQRLYLRSRNDNAILAYVQSLGELTDGQDDKEWAYVLKVIRERSK